MFPKIMKWVSLAALVLAIGVRQFATNYSVLPQLVIFVGACVIALQGIHEKKYGWAAAFAAIAILFNPVLILVPIQTVAFFVLVAACIATFAFSLIAVKATPLLSIPSITDRNPGSESL